MTMLQRIAYATAAVGVSATLATAALAAEPTAVMQGELAIGPRGRAELRGTVTAVDATAKTVHVRIWGMDWTARVAADAKLVNGTERNAAALTDIQVGHILRIAGDVDAAAPLTVTVHRIVDMTLRAQVATFAGTITDLTAPDGFGLQLRSRGRVGVKLASGATIMDHGTGKAFSDFMVGANVRVRGTYDTQTNVVMGASVEFVPVEVRGFLQKSDRDEKGGPRLGVQLPLKMRGSLEGKLHGERRGQDR